MQLMIGKVPSFVKELCRLIADAGGRAWLVGGSVRDLLLGKGLGDPDLEVYGLDWQRLRQILAGIGRVEWVGRRFGVFKLWRDGACVDIALPRREYKTAPGHKGFDVRTDPHLDPETASKRRDFTINAMMLDPLTGDLLDFHGGRRDLRAGILRHVSPAFSEDPLRVLRGMQFASRFDFKLAPETVELCRRLRGEAGSLPRERIWMEWEKWTSGRHPSSGLTVLQQTQWLELYPELNALVECPQEPKWHPEGDVWRHTLLAVDCAALAARDRDWRDRRRTVLVFAALCHDLGKPVCTYRDEQGRIRSPEHSRVGVERSREFLDRIGAPAWIFERVAPLVKEHLCHMHGRPTARAVRRLAHRLEPADIEMWEALVEADASARPPRPHSRPALAWLETARRLAADKGKPEPIVNGRMLLQLGLKPGPEMGKIIRLAYEKQLDGIITDEASALDWCMRYLKKKEMPGKEKGRDS